MPYVLQDRRVGLREPIDSLVDTIGVNSQLHEFVARIALVDDTTAVSEELSDRESKGDDIEGDINFCICRLLVGYTKMHEDPRYWKVNLINKVLRKAQSIVIGTSRCWFTQDTMERAAAVLDDVKMELYRRYAGPYEDEKRKLNGDIMS